MKQILATFPLRNFLRVFALVTAVSATSCSKDPAVDGELHGDMLRFAVAEADGWNTQLRCGAAGSEEKSAASPENVAEVFSLRGENPADTLFLHASVADGIAAPYPNVQTDRLQTRATPVETGTFYDSFGVLASVYTGTWSEDSCLPDYMYDVEVTEASSWTTSYYWPGAGRNIRFFAYAPYGGQGIVLSDKTSAGTPSITYTVPTAVADQQDLLVAATSGMAGNTAAAAPLSFAHALTAVRFTTGDDMMSGRITKITLKGVYGSGSHTMGSDSWNGYGATTDFSQTLAATVDGSADQEITPVAATFMMLPQTLPSGASIEGRLYGRPDFDTTNFNRLYRRQPMADGQNRHLPDFDVEHRNHSDFYRDGSGRFYLCRRQRKLFGDQLCRRFPSGRCYANRSGGLDRRICRG